MNGLGMENRSFNSVKAWGMVKEGNCFNTCHIFPQVINFLTSSCTRKNKLNYFYFIIKVITSWLVTCSVQTMWKLVGMRLHIRKRKFMFYICCLTGENWLTEGENILILKFHNIVVNNILTSVPCNILFYCIGMQNLIMNVMNNISVVFLSPL